jgi:hypothetical protein
LPLARSAGWKYAAGFLAHSHGCELPDGFALPTVIICDCHTAPLFKVSAQAFC